MVCSSLSHLSESKFPSLCWQDGQRLTDSQVGIWSMYQGVPRQASHSLQMSYNYCHGKLKAHQGIYETYFCWNIDNTSLWHKDAELNAVSDYFKVIDLQRWATWGQRGNARRWERKVEEMESRQRLRLLAAGVTLVWCWWCQRPSLPSQTI